VVDKPDHAIADPPYEHSRLTGNPRCAVRKLC
jgi:hypothetical protein